MTFEWYSNIKVLMDQGRDSSRILSVTPHRTGRYLTCDSQGWLVPDVDLRHLDGDWGQAVAWVQEQVQGHAHSLYLRGSVPRGLAISGISDLDFVCLSPIAYPQLEKTLEPRLQQLFPMVCGLELLWIHPDKLGRVTAPQTRPYFEMLLKTMSVHLFGDNPVQGALPFSVGVKLASHLFLIEKEFAQLPAQIQALSNPQEVAATRKWFSKRLVRAGLEVCLDRIQRFSRDLYLCYETFAEFYPEYEREMWAALENCLDARHDPRDFDRLVRVLTAEGQRRF